MTTTEPQTIWEQIEFSSLGQYIAADPLAFPMIESVHVIAIVTVVGAIMIMDLRMLGFASNAGAISRISRETVRLTWVAFVFAAITGVLLFISKASNYMNNPYFLMKLGFIVLAGVNMAWFHLITQRSQDQWDSAANIPTSVKVAGALSLTLWLLVIFFGRAIGFTLSFYMPM
jgi:hypothetical protein